MRLVTLYTQEGKSPFMNGFVVNMTLPYITNEIGQIECNKILQYLRRSKHIGSLIGVHKRCARVTRGINFLSVFYKVVKCRLFFFLFFLFLNLYLTNYLHTYTYSYLLTIT